MRTECISDTNFQGKLIITNRLSNKPNNCINKVKSSLENLILKKDYNLYITQDYTQNKICISAKYPVSMLNEQGENLQINSKASRYIDAAKNAISKYENALSDKEQKIWEQNKKESKKQEIKDIAGVILFFPFFIVGDILHSINPKWSNKFEKLIDRII